MKDYLDDAIRTSEDLERIVPLPVLAVIPVDPPPDNLPIAISRPEDYAVETYRGLRTDVQFLGIERTLRVLQVTSSLAAEGKTTTATNWLWCWHRPANVCSSSTPTCAARGSTRCSPSSRRPGSPTCSSARRPVS